MILNSSIRIAIARLAAIFLLTIAATAYSQNTEPRQCDTQATDPDGDGFGWEWNRDIGALDTCRITQESFSPPQLVNPETGEEVQLIRAYWNANRDIAERSIECKGYSHDTATNRITNEFSAYDTLLFHNTLPNSPPYMAFAEYDQLPFPRFPDIPLYKTWTVIDGRYIGPMSDTVFGNAGDMDYIEIIDATDTRPAGIRIWGSIVRECFDASGAAFGPTGFIGEEFPSEDPENRSLVVRGKPAPAYSETLTNLDSGEPVQLTDAYWDMYKHFWQRSITCLPFSWNGSSYSPVVSSMVINRFYAVDKGPQSGFVGTRFGTFGGDGGTNDEWTVVDDTLEVSGFWPITLYDKVEVIPATDDSRGYVRSWHSSESYTQCRNNAGLMGPYENEQDKQDFIPLDPESLQLTNNNPSSNTQVADTSNTSDNSASTNTSDATGDLTSNLSGGGTFTLWMLGLFIIVTRYLRYRSGRTFATQRI